MLSIPNTYAKGNLIVQTCVDSSSTYVTPIKGNIYSTYKKNNPYFTYFGTAKIFDTATITKKMVTKQGWWIWDKTYGEYDDKKIVVYKMSKIVDSRIEMLYDDYIFVSKDTTFSGEYSIEGGKTYTYEKETANRYKSCANMSNELSLKIGLFDLIDGGLKSTMSNSYETEVSSKVSKTTSQYYSEKITQKFEIPATKESTWYAYERRARFYVYIIQVYEVLYNSSTTRKYSDGYMNDNTEYTVVGYKLEEQNIKFTYVDDSTYRGYVKYQSNDDGTFSYSDIKNSNYVYF